MIRKYGTLTLDEMIMTINKVAFRDQAIWLSGSLVANRVIAKGEILTGIRLHGSDGSLITNVPDAELVLPKAVKPGDQIVLELDFHMNYQTSDWGGQH